MHKLVDVYCHKIPGVHEESLGMRLAGVLHLLYLYYVLTWLTLARGVVSKLICWTCLHTDTTRLIEWHCTAA